VTGSCESSKQRRLLIPPGGRPFGRWAKILLQLEQGRLLASRGLSCGKLLPAQLTEALPAEGVAVDDQVSGFAMTRFCSGRVGLSGDFFLCRKSAARCAWDAVLKIARLSSFSTLIHDAI
jgi:hypothetical protein